MKICLITDVLSPQTGWGRYAAEIIRGLLAAGVDCRILSPRERCTYNDLASHQDHHDITSYMEDSRHFARLLGANYLRSRSLFQGCDLVHCLTEPYAPLTWLASRQPYVLSAVGTFAIQPLGTRLHGWLHRKAFQNAQAVTCISGYTERRLTEQIPLDNTRVVPLGVNLSEFALEAPVAQPDHPVLLSVGMIKERKGIHVALEALANVVEHHPRAHYYIVGPQERSAYFARLDGMVKELGLQSHVTFVGEVSEEELVAWYHRATVFVLPSLSVGDHFEGFGLVHLEANACGTPAVGTWESGTEEVIVDSENGFLVPQQDPAALADAIVRLLDDEALAQRMSTAARARAQQMTWQKTVDQLIALYAQLLGTHAPLPVGCERAEPNA
jgi:glycosyltransferase involved in cell wall biosynthesis